MKKWLLTLLFSTALVLTACGGGGDDGGTDEGGNGGDGGDTGTEESSEGGSVDTAAAEEIFESNCASCHGADLSGGVGPNLTAVGADYSADEIADIIQNGKGSMQPVDMPDEDRDTISNWLAGME